MNHIKYAWHRFPFWMSWISVIIGIVAIIPFPDQWSIFVPIGIVTICFLSAFIIPFCGSFLKKEYSIATIGKSSISLRFGSIFDQDCFVVTTNRNFDITPDDHYISRTSLLAKFIDTYYPNNVSSLISEITTQLVVPVKNKK